MREIKFRAWDKMQEEMSRSLELDAIALQETETWFKSGMCHYNSLIFMQFTGLLDKNGKEIYEGDIISNENGEKYLIIWVEDICAFYQAMVPWSRITTLSIPSLIPHIMEMRFNLKEVIGNIYETPELLSTPKPKES